MLGTRPVTRQAWPTRAIRSSCARLYGKRAAKNRAERALKAMEENDG